ncbi:hypothetical protein FRC98_11945 [Lujinxingia vulgaris]|uniref:Uncharacterized protein n=1 Tax=Lujinxingia vulgaris TaxID=2600176 RepID=A0A5C6XEK5_9DELT|nr:hypothetical protein [Lujinxingia vulgaris]TXD36544.1 hypothetical protein FRC98_11945 [Lujinxingia vulgaris]
MVLETLEQWILPVAAVVAGVGGVGAIAYYLWRLQRVDAFWEAFREARGWDKPHDKLMDIALKAETRQGAVRMQAGYTEGGNGRPPLFVLRFDFDAPFPEELKVIPRRSDLREQPADARFGPEDWKFHHEFSVHKPSPECEVFGRLANPEFAQVMLELKRPGVRLWLKEGRLSLTHTMRLTLDQEVLGRLIDEAMAHAQKIAAMSGLTPLEDEPPKSEPGGAEVNDVWEREVASSRVEW